MTPGEFREFIKVMHEYGVAEATINGVTLKMAYSFREAPKPQPVSHPQVQEPDVQGVSLTPEDPIKHKVEQLSSLMKLSDSELVDELFPDHTQDEEHA